MIQKRMCKAHSRADAQSRSDIFRLRVMRILAERFFLHRKFYEEKKRNQMHPTGIEPALKASEASVLSIRLQVQILQICYASGYHITEYAYCPVTKGISNCYQPHPLVYYSHI